MLGHAGPVGNLPGKKILGPSKGRTMMGDKVTAITKGEIDEVVEQFARGAAMLADTGFDSVEIHLGHGYLLSSFMSPKLNRRTDEYGGSIENRIRFTRETLEDLRSEIDDCAIGMRFSIDTLDDFKRRLPELLRAEGPVFVELHTGLAEQTPMTARGGVPFPEQVETLRVRLVRPRQAG